ncbi:Uncharacterized protein APZ42_011599 [Daphnia magna]|uniref:Uncharacterized protein n=1 Tax=Daphnia magna TaxID=35525 RepID=A0A162CZH3_9CRUS|nr:Uncharacterized protein APZ42_011599 [Daphnia magna]
MVNPIFRSTPVSYCKRKTVWNSTCPKTRTWCRKMKSSGTSYN